METGVIACCTKYKLYNTHSIIVDVVIFSCSFATFRYEIVLDRIILVTLCHALCTAHYVPFYPTHLACVFYDFEIIRIYSGYVMEHGA